MNQDNEHLRLLSIFHYIVGGFTAFFSFFPLIYVVLGIVFIVSPETFSEGSEDVPAELLGILFIVLGSIFFIIGLVTAVFSLITGRFLTKRKKYMFCMVTACIECLCVPFGTILGVMTLIVMTRASVKTAFKGGSRPPGLPTAPPLAR